VPPALVVPSDGPAYRRGKARAKGIFWGCAGYPECKGIRGPVEPERYSPEKGFGHLVCPLRRQRFEGSNRFFEGADCLRFTHGDLVKDRPLATADFCRPIINLFPTPRAEKASFAAEDAPKKGSSSPYRAAARSNEVLTPSSPPGCPRRKLTAGSRSAMY